MKRKRMKPFVHAHSCFGVWNVFIDGIPLKGDGFGGLAEFETEAEAIKAGEKAGPQPSPWK